MTTIRRLPGAVADLDEIWEYIFAQNAAAADRVLGRIIAATDRLIDYPYSGQIRDEIGATARGISVPPYVVLYRVVGNVVEVVRVMHTARNLLDAAADFSTD
ncbi:type II toxin-antitoxin system RelE/ParE family toxin [Sphingomonas sp. PB4P5]|uniref:type II toxin-antitoxin system RelE/ParE family toxin n=1 Tax=Parasphingomonas puruogangriensis TaxID=3096155 RepID=UPI002FC6B331